MVDEPSVEDTIAILRGLKERYEVHHGVRIKDAAIMAAATLSHRYITDRFLPDKAIDLIDEAAASLRMQIDSLPTEIDEIERRILQLEIERQALLQGNRRAFHRAAEQIEKELARLREESSARKARWQVGEGGHRQNPQIEGADRTAQGRRDSVSSVPATLRKLRKSATARSCTAERELSAAQERFAASAKRARAC